MTPGIISKPYADIVDEWVSWNRNTNRPMPLADYARFMDQREGGQMRAGAYEPSAVKEITDAVNRMAGGRAGTITQMSGARTGYRADQMPRVAAPTGMETRPGDVTGEMGASAFRSLGELVNKMPESTIRADMTGSIAGPVTQAVRVEPGTRATPEEWEAAGRGLGSAAPTMAATAPLMVAGWPGLLLAGGATAAETYADTGSPTQAAVSGALIPVGGAAVGAGARLGEELALRGLFEGAETMVGQTPQAFGQSAARALTTSISPQAAALVQAGRYGGGVTAGTAVNEAGRQATSLIETGELAPVSPLAIATDVAANAAFAGPMLKAGFDPAYRSMQTRAAGNVAEAQAARNAAAQARSQRGTRVATAHREILDSLRAGQDPARGFANARRVYDEIAAEQPASTVGQGLRALASYSQEANAGRLSDDQFTSLVAGVQGRFTDTFKADPTGTPYGTVEELVKRGLLPKLDRAWIEENYRDAVDQMLGDEQGAKANLINRIYATYQERLPGALEQMRAQPVQEGMTRQALNAQSEADKDALYMQSLAKLYPAMKGMKTAEGKPLDEALWNQDLTLSSATQGGQLASESTAWSRFDAWKNAIIKMAETYDPTTRRGTFLPSRRMSDGSYLELPAQTTSLEEMAQPDFLSHLVPTRKIGRAGSSGSLRDAAIEFVDERFRRPDEQVEEDITNIEDPEAFAKERASLVRDRDVEVPDDATLTDEANELGLTPEETAQYIESMKNEPRGFGVDLPATDRKDYYDIAIHLANKVEKLTNAELWQQYGGERLFGKGAKSPGKFDLFKDALLARMESEMDDTGQLSAAQKKFYEAWRTNADTKGGEIAPLAKTWKEQRAQFRHALRLYWAKGSVSMPDLFMSMLSDKPRYQEMLRAKPSAGSTTQSIEEPPLQNLPVQSVPLPVRDQSMTYYTGMRTPLIDSLRLFRGFATKLGLGEQFANEYATIAGKMVQAFDETAGVGKLVGVPGVLGQNIASTVLKGPTVAINLDMINAADRPEMTKAVQALRVLAHELAHNYSDSQQALMQQNQDSAYKQQRVDSYARMHAMFNEIGVDATTDLINRILPDVFYPDHFRPPVGVSLTHGDFGQEAISTFMEHVMLGAMTKDNPWQSGRKGESFGEALKWLPDEVQAFTHLALRDVANFASGIKQLMTLSGNKKAAQMFDHVLNSATEYLRTNAAEQRQYRMTAESMLARLGASGSSSWDDPAVIETTYDLDSKALKELTSGSNQISLSLPDKSAMSEARDFMFGKLTPEHEKRLGTTVPPWSRYMGLFYQAMRRYQKAGVPLAENAAHLVNDLEPAYFRLTRSMHEPFLTTDKQGRLIYDPNHPVQEILQNRTPDAVKARKALNELYLWQNENATPVVERGQDGKLVVTQKAGSTVKTKLASLDPKSQQGVLEGLDALIRGYKNAADLVFNAQSENVAARLAGIFMTVDRSMAWDVAFKQAQQATQLAIGWTNAQKQLADAKAKTPMMVPQLEQQFAPINQQFGQMMMSMSPELQGIMREYLLNKNIAAVQVPGKETIPARVVPGMAQKLLDLDTFFKKRAGWFGSETRPGRFFISSRMPGVEGTKHYTSATNRPEADRIAKELAAQGHTDFSLIDRQNKDDAQIFAQPDAVVNDFLKTERQSWEDFLANMQQQLSEEDMTFLKNLGYVPGEASEKKIAIKALDRYMQPRELTAGRERLDAFDVFRDYTSRLSGTVARRSLRQQVELLLRDPRVRKEGQFKQTVQAAMESLMTPIDDRFVAVRSAMTAYYLGLPNIVSPIIEGMQSTTSILPYLVDEQGFKNGVKTYRNAIVAPAKMMDLGKTLESKRLLQSASDKALADPTKMTKEEAVAYYYKRANDEGAFQYGPIYSSTLSRDHQLLTQQAFGLGTTTPKTRDQLVTDPIYWAAQKTMWLYSHMSAYNNRVGMLAALDMLYDRGLRGNDLYTAASTFKNLSVFGGGKANSIGFTNKLSNPTSRSAFSLIETLQRYSFGSLTMFKDFAADAMGRTGLSKAERAKATQAFATAMTGSFFLAGALGIPGLAIASAVVTQLSGGKVDPRQKMREMVKALANGLGADDPMAVTIANVAQNGVVSNALGVDVSNRMSTNSVLGFNAYDGFNTSELFGVGSSIIEGMVEGTKSVAKGDMVKAGTSIVPPSWRPYVDLAASKAQYGDFALRDQSKRMVMPLTGGEAAAYALGLRPTRYRYIRDEQRALQNAQQANASQRDQRLDELAQELLRGNNAAVMQHIQQLRASDPTVQPQPVVGSVIDRAVDMQRPIDLLARTQQGGDERAREIAASFGNVAPRQSEVQDLMTKTRLNAQTGFMGGQPPMSQDFQRAAMVDALVKQRGMTRAEALRMVTLMGY